MTSPMSKELSMNEVEVCLADIESWPSQQPEETSEVNYMALLQRNIHLSNDDMINRSVSPASEFDSINYYTDFSNYTTHDEHMDEDLSLLGSYPSGETYQGQNAWDETSRSAVFNSLPASPASPSLASSSSASFSSSTSLSSSPSNSSQDFKRNKRTPKKPRAKKTQLQISIPGPLSIITKDYEVPLKDMNAWVNRSAETRQAEAALRGGYVTRPMNNFMLYRSAFSERTKEWCHQNNHQVVSSLSGISWPLEPQEVHDYYTDLARIERDNHQKAHPGYKFSPSKGAGGKSRRGKKRAVIEDETDLDLDFDLGMLQNENDEEYTPTAKKSRSRKSTKSASSKPTTAMRSSFQFNNPSLAPPTGMPTSNTDMDGQYYQTTVRASSVTPSLPNPDAGCVIEDVTIQMTQAPIKRMPMEDGYLDPALFSEAEFLNAGVQKVESCSTPASDLLATPELLHESLGFSDVSEQEWMHGWTGTGYAQPSTELSKLMYPAIELWPCAEQNACMESNFATQSNFNGEMNFSTDQNFGMETDFWDDAMFDQSADQDFVSMQNMFSDAA
ncbi:hypothetical protein BZA77DRAFT_384944 [Pyronema omphalodes]|nr:hypothetical protein BZA77DRAFT_384944 [Pyronema omphalodes]